MLTESGKLLLNLFCQRVDVVIEIKEMNAAITPIKGNSSPISKPKTTAAPVNPKTTPIHCLIVTFSLRSGPASIIVRTGC